MAAAFRRFGVAPAARARVAMTAQSTAATSQFTFPPLRRARTAEQDLRELAQWLGRLGSVTEPRNWFQACPLSNAICGMARTRPHDTIENRSAYRNLFQRGVQMLKNRYFLIPVAAVAVLLGSVTAPGPAAAAGLSHVQGVYQPILRQGSVHPNGVTGLSYSSTWSGYVTNGGGTFLEVASSWVLPAATCGPPSNFAAFWVGIDNVGQTDRIGTEVDCLHTIPVYREYWATDPNNPVYPGLPLYPGDQLTATINYQHVSRLLGGYVLTLTDSTQGWTLNPPLQYGNVAHSSAEVIVEEPFGGGTYPLTTFGTVTFTGTSINGSPLLSSSLTQLDLMDPNTGSTDYTSGITNNTDFSVTDS
jgi:hypothetical protein